MEFPNLGKQCTEPHCNQLDYLPLKCDACGGIFCGEHVSYARHKCPSAYMKDVQVPVCPLCNTLIPVKRGEQPDVVVGAHIDSDCLSDPAKNRRKVFINRCSVKNCKVKEVVPIICDGCKRNFCLKHRHPTDHQCEGKVEAARRKAADAAFARHAQTDGVSSSSSSSSGTPPQNTTQANIVTVQGGLSEDEALARALALSLYDTSGSNDTTHDNEDLMLARAIAESERQQAQTPRSGSNSRCNVA